MPIVKTIADALTIMVPGQGKSLRDSSTAGQLVDDSRGGVALVSSASLDGDRQAFKKQNVIRWRMWAEYSWCVRTAIDIHRNFVSLVQPDVTAIDPKKPIDTGIQREVQDLLSMRMSNGDSYSEIKEKMVEDYFVVSHGVAELWLKNNSKPSNITSLDAARIAFYRNWDGSQDQPRYAEISGNGTIIRRLGDQHVMSMVNRKRSYDVLGLSHVECLETAVQAILAGDDNLLNEIRYPSASGALSLGENVGAAMADEVRSKIMQAAKHAFIVISGSKNPKFINFKPIDLKKMDKQIWFVRQVAAMFGLPITVFAQATDSNRANTTALLDYMGEGLKDTIIRVKNAENNDIMSKYGSSSKHNLQIDYPILNSKDALKQAELSAIQLAKQPLASINEARRDNGLTNIELPIADDILLQSSTGLVSLKQLNDQIYNQQPQPNNGPVPPEGQ
jgi:hypothetical protein